MASSEGLGRSPSRKPGRLAARCRMVDGMLDVVVNVEPRQTDGTLGYLCSVLSPDVMRELERRGFDPFTMRFQIDRKR